MGNFYTSNKNKNNVLFFKNCNSSVCFQQQIGKLMSLLNLHFHRMNEHRINDKTVKIMLTFPPRNQR